MSAQLPVLDESPPAVAQPSGNWLVSRDELARHRDTQRPLSFFDRMVWAIAEAMFNSEKGPPPPERLAWLCADMRDFLLRSGPRARWIFWAALFFTSWISPLLLGKLPPLARLRLHERAEALERFENGMVLQAASILALKATLCIVYFEHPDAAHEIGFDGLCKGASQ